MSKSCPNCGYHFTLRKFAGIKSMHFDCPGCRAKLKTDMRWFVLAAVLAAPIMAYPIMWAVHNPKIWPLVPVAMVAVFIVYYLMFSVSSAHNKVGNGGAK